MASPLLLLVPAMQDRAGCVGALCLAHLVRLPPAHAWLLHQRVIPAVPLGIQNVSLPIATRGFPIFWLPEASVAILLYGPGIPCGSAEKDQVVPVALPWRADPAFRGARDLPVASPTRPAAP